MKNLLEAAVNVVVIAGIPLFFVQLEMSRQSSITQNTLGYVARFNSEPLLEDKIRLVEMWDLGDLQAMNDSEVSQVVLNKFVSDTVETTPGAVKSVLRLREFRRELGICLEACLCSRANARDFIVEEYFVDFKRVYGSTVQVIEQRHLLNPTNIGELVEEEGSQCDSVLHRLGLR